jgi:diacylglycerol kinase
VGGSAGGAEKVLSHEFGSLRIQGLIASTPLMMLMLMLMLMRMLLLLLMLLLMLMLLLLLLELLLSAIGPWHRACDRLICTR